MSDEPKFSPEPFDGPPERQAKYQFAAVVNQGMVYAALEYLDDIHIQMAWPYAKHTGLKFLVDHMDDFIEGARMHYEATLGAGDIDKDLEALFAEGDEQK